MTDPAAHPPSPRRQRANAAAHARPAEPAKRQRRPGYLLAHWRGELPLAVAVIVSVALVWGAVQIVGFASRHVLLTDYPQAAAALLMLELLILIPGVVWWGTGVMRSAARHVGRGGSALVASLTGVVGFGAFLWAGAFWWQSARYVVPDAWATLVGTAKPAVVEIEPGTSAARATGARLLVFGELEFGTTQSVRAALDAHPEISTIRLESPGGRAAEGLALGRLILDRNKDTLVTGECSSACVSAFAGGARRSIGRHARLGLHSVGGRGVSAATLAAVNRRSDTFIANRGVDAHLLEEGSAVSNDSIWFPPAGLLLKSELATEYADERP